MRKIVFKYIMVKQLIIKDNEIIIFKKYIYFILKEVIFKKMVEFLIDIIEFRR